MGVVSRLKKKGIIKDDELEKDKQKREESLKKSQEELPKASEFRNSLKTSKKTEREEDSDNWFQERNKGKKLKRVQSDNSLPKADRKELAKTIFDIGLATVKNDEKLNNILNTAQNLGSSAYTGIMQFRKTLNERMTDRQNLRMNLTNSNIDRWQKYGNEKDKEKAKAIAEGQAKLLGLKQNKDTGKIDEIKYEDANKEIQKKIDEENKKMSKRVEDSTGFEKITSEFASSLGNNLVGGAVSLINPMLGATYFVGSATGSYEDDARERGMEGNGAKLYAGIMGGVEGTLDYVFNFGALQSGFKAIGKESAEKIISKFGTSMLGNGIENAIQEGITEPINELIAGMTGGKDKANWENIGQRMYKSALYGFASGLIFDGIGRGLGSISNIQNKINNGEELSPTDLQNVVQELEASGMSREEIFEASKNNALEAVNAEAQRIKEEQQAEVNQIQDIEQLPVANEQNTNSNKLRKIAENEINNSNISNKDKQEMLETLNSTEQITEADMKAIRNTINETATAKVVRDTLSRNGTFQEQVDKYISGDLPSGDFLYLGDTPQILQKIGLPNNEVILKQSKLKSLMQESNDNTDKFHGIPAETIKRIPEAIGNPLNVLKSSTDENSIIIITDLADTSERPIIASIEVNYDGQIGKIDFLSNRLTSAYGKNNYDRFMQTEIEKGNMLYDIDEGIIKELPTTRLQSPKGISSFVDANNNASTSNNSIPQSTENVKSDSTINNNFMQKIENNTKNNILNPSEIANSKKETASTTPKLSKKEYEKGNKQSSFVSNILTDSQFLNKDLRQEMGKEDSIKYYKGITNAETLEKAYNSLKKGGEKETLNWFSKNEKNTTAEDVTKGWILLKQYQDAGDYQGAVEVAKKMRQMGTNAGQAVQAYNIMSRLTPEGMFYYAQSELNEAYNKMVEGKSKAWIDSNQDKFNLTPEETQTIMDTMREVSNMEDGREKTVKLAQIQKLVSDKIPPSAGQSIKAWMRISMLFNPKTQVRNVLGNAVVLPVNTTADIFSGAIDKLVSKKTGVRTTGLTKEGVKGYAKGFGKGLFESYDDFRKGINTRDVKGNRFEIGEGKSFKDKGLGKALNRVDNLLSFSLDAGDRGFYEATFTNSINNQLVLNNTTEVTKDMIDIATNEALQRTWQDDNDYTQAVLGIRRILNKPNVKGYGFGDVLIPFAKTPANLTKAIVDYSPVGLTKTLTLDARKFYNSLNNGQYSAQLQHKFVQNLGKGMAGSVLYVLGYALAKSGIATGEADDDKDVKNFMKNSLGISSYSLKIGDKSFSYDWAQPIATPLAIMTNYVKYSKDNPNANAIEKAIKSLDIGTEQLLQQSFMESINTVLNGNGTTMENITKAILDLPARAIPTFSKQIADMIDSTQRTSFEYGKPLQSAKNSVIAKIPFASKTLPASIDTLGNEVKKYGGNNNVWNVMFNPANTNKGKLSKAGEEIYKVYMQTGDTTIFPRTAPYYINNKGEKITMTANQRSEFQKVSGQYVEKTLTNLLNSSDYKKLSDEKKANIINEIVSDSYSKAKYDILKLDSKEYTKLRNTLKNVSTTSYYDYKQKTEGMKKDTSKISVLTKSKYTNKEKQALYENYILDSTNTTYPLIKKFFSENGLNINSYLNYTLQNFESDKKDNGTVKGKSISGSRKKKVYNYINNMDISYTQRLLLIGTQYKLNNTERARLANFVNNSDLSYDEKMTLYGKFKGFKVYKNGTITY